MAHVIMITTYIVFTLGYLLLDLSYLNFPSPSERGAKVWGLSIILPRSKKILNQHVTVKCPISMIHLYGKYSKVKHRKNAVINHTTYGYHMPPRLS